jgi:hypothetical protein
MNRWQVFWLSFSFGAFPLFQFYPGKNSGGVYQNISHLKRDRITAAGTAPELNRIPFSSNAGTN